MTECMQTCPKFQQSRAPDIKNDEDISSFMEKLAEIVFMPRTSTFFPTTFSGAVWLAMTRNEKGRWIDWYTGNRTFLMKDTDSKKILLK